MGLGEGDRIMFKQVLSGLCAAFLFLFAPGAIAGEQDSRAYLDEARKVSSGLLGELRGELMRELERSGPVRAINVCRYSAPELSATISRQTGMRVTRVSLRPRNPLIGEPDAWEQRALLDFEKRITDGEKAEALELSEVVVEPAGRYFRYAKAIPMGALCLACHGPAENISEAVRARLSVEYPRDRGVNYHPGQIRGAVSVKKPL